MSTAPASPPAAAPNSAEVLRGLDAADADRPARAVLAAVGWESVPLDPGTTRARDFLAQL